MISGEVIDLSLFPELKKETWKFQEQEDEDFDGLPIEYDNDFKDKKEYGFSQFNNNVGVISRRQSGEGFTLLAMLKSGSNYFIQSAEGAISGDKKINADIAIANLIKDHHLSGRPYAKGAVNGSTTNLGIENYQKVETRIPFEEQHIDFDYLISTEMGNAEVIEISIPLSGEMATLIYLLDE
jgi:hypothetical protein